MKLKHMVAAIVTAVFLASWLGCGEESAPPKSAAPVVKKVEPAASPQTAPAKAPTPEKPAPQAGAKPPEKPPAAEPPAKPPAKPAGYSYNPGNRPDPFRPFFEEAKAAAIISECEGIPPGPLTEQEVSQFTLVAVLAQGPEAVAMVQDSTGKGYVVRVGSFVGKKCGKVSAIGPEGATIDEPYKDMLGQTQIRKVILGFKASEGGKGR